MWEHCGHCSSFTQGPQLNNEEKIAVSCAGTWNNAHLGGAQVGLHEFLALTKLSSCCHLALVRGFNSYFQLAEAEPEQLQYMFIICSYTRVRAW